MRQNNIRVPHFSLIRYLTAYLALAALLFTSLAAVSGQSMKAKQTTKAGKLTEDQRILHVLNRLGFGARPGDVERLKAIGVDKYIEQQLNPEKIDDSASEAKLKNLETLRLTTAELYEKYPQPNQLLQQLQRRNALPADLAAARENRAKNATNTSEANQSKTGEAMTGDMQGSTAPNAQRPNTQPNDTNPMNNAEYRRAVMEYYRE